MTDEPLPPEVVTEQVRRSWEVFRTMPPPASSNPWEAIELDPAEERRMRVARGTMRFLILLRVWPT